MLEQMAEILVVEDDKDIAHLTTLHLKDAGYSVDCVHDGEDGLNAALEQPYDLIILDVMLPGMDGFEICRLVREKKPSVLVIMLTAKSGEVDRVLGLEIGADDYLTKPFSMRELQARVKALLRRREKFQPDSVGEEEQIVSGELVIDLEKREVNRANTMISLTAKEFDLLVQFARHPGKAYSRTQLLDLVWGYGYEGFEHTVNSHINRLRAKLEADPAKPEYIQTVWGIGYKFNG